MQSRIAGHAQAIHGKPQLKQVLSPAGFLCVRGRCQRLAVRRQRRQEHCLQFVLPQHCAGIRVPAHDVVWGMCRDHAPADHDRLRRTPARCRGFPHDVPARAVREDRRGSLGLVRPRKREITVASSFALHLHLHVGHRAFAEHKRRRRSRIPAIPLPGKTNGIGGGRPPVGVSERHRCAMGNGDGSEKADRYCNAMDHHAPDSDSVLQGVLPPSTSFDSPVPVTHRKLLLEGFLQPAFS